MSALSVLLGTKPLPTDEEVVGIVVQLADWLHLEAAMMADSGKTAGEVAARLKDLKEVVADWHEQSAIAIPEGEPWNWKRGDLEDFIASRRKEW